MIKTATIIAAVLALAGCSYNAESSFLGYRSSISYSTPGAAPPPGPPPSSGPQTSCYRPGYYSSWGYWVPGGYRC